jgi:EAL domain-containing protein (putative c-di-GMP-specific phosphodiesterase class I)
VQALSDICCDTLDILVIAGGVETQAEEEALAGIGVTLLQGPRFGAPARDAQNPWAKDASAS